MSSSVRFNLPFLAPGQAQKEMFHNEALQLLDVIVAACVEEPPRTTPPGSPVPGTCYLVGSGADGAWSQFGLHLAAYTDAGWRFVSPVEGLQAWVRSTQTMAQFRNGAWDVGTISGDRLHIGGKQVVSIRGAAVAGPTGGTVVDLESRSAINAVLDRLRAHGLIA
jgi:hypothetical protein